MRRARSANGAITRSSMRVPTTSSCWRTLRGSSSRPRSRKRSAGCCASIRACCPGTAAATPSTGPLRWATPKAGSRGFGSTRGSTRGQSQFRKPSPFRKKARPRNSTTSRARPMARSAALRRTAGEARARRAPEHRPGRVARDVRAAATAEAAGAVAVYAGRRVSGWPVPSDPMMSGSTSSVDIRSSRACGVIWHHSVRSSWKSSRRSRSATGAPLDVDGRHFFEEDALAVWSAKS